MSPTSRELTATSTIVARPLHLHLTGDLERETSDALFKRFRGFSGYVQADAKRVFNLLFEDAEEKAGKQPDVQHDGCERSEVGAGFVCATASGRRPSRRT